MTASELAFLGLGLLLGAASGAALFVLLGSRLPRREIRVTVTPNAVPRRSDTLSQDAFVTSPAEPARGGPADRRGADRGDPGPDEAADPGVIAPAPAPVGIRIHPEPGMLAGGAANRTIVPTGPGAPLPRSRHERRERPRISTTVPVGAATAPVAGLAAGPVAGAVATLVDAPAEAAPEGDSASGRASRGSPLERLLRGEHRAMAELLDRLAGEDGARRRQWELLLGGLVEGMADAAVQEGVVDFPMGTAFWDTFTVEQCRRIVGALASMGYTYDGRDGWAGGRVPAYRDLAQALADVGIDPRRIRAWPNSTQIAALFAGARPAPEELLAAAGPDYEAHAMRELLGARAEALGDLWLAWDAVRPALLEEPEQPEPERLEA